MNSNQLDMSEVDLPLATVSMEHTVREMMSCGLSSNEYAARQAHLILCFSLDQYRYRDVVLQAWIHSLGAILSQKTGAPNLNDLLNFLLLKKFRRFKNRNENLKRCC